MTGLTDCAQVREVINRLHLPVPDLATLRFLLCSPLGCIGLLPPRFKRFNDNPLPANAIKIPRHIPLLQRVLLEHVVPTWQATLTEQKESLLIEQYFCPDSFSYAFQVAGEVALLAYSSILSLPLKEYSIQLLARLSKEYPIDRLHFSLFSDEGTSIKQTISWEDCVRNVVTVPAKAANAFGERGVILPILEQKAYFENVSIRCEALMHSMASKTCRHNIPSITYLLTKLVNLGVFPPTPPTVRSQPSFFEATLPTIRARLKSESQEIYSALWCEVLSSIPSSFTLQVILASLFSSLSPVRPSLSPSPQNRSLVIREAMLLGGLMGPLSAHHDELWECLSAVTLGRPWSEGHGRIFACWVAGPEKHTEKALEILLSKILDVWTSPDHIKHSLLALHRYLTSLLLVTISYFSPSSPHLIALATSTSFISGVGTYIGHLDNSIRHCGMLVAEEVAQRAGKRLAFDDWEGDDAGKPWARDMRTLITERDLDFGMDGLDDAPAEGNIQQSEGSFDATVMPILPQSKHPSTALPAGYDSDDSLTGYASPSSSRSVSPTPSELDEVEKDPTLHVGVTKIPRPVYLAQLGEMLRSTGGLNSREEGQEVNKIEMALRDAEELIRRKTGYGMELDENAVNLVYGLVGLQNNYDVDGFETKRQGALVALIACCPRKAAPAMIEEFFKNQYSVNQRFAILNSLALGAREMASSPNASAVTPKYYDRTAFPSKILPVNLHRKYLAAGDQGGNEVQQMLDTIRREAIDGGKAADSENHPELFRERRLRIRRSVKVTEVPSTHKTIARQIDTAKTTFTEVASEFFVVPLINRFWLFLRDEQVREERTARREALHRYHGAGTGLILNAMVLARFLATLAILVHTSRNAPEWLAVAAPDALELAVTLGTRPVSQGEGDGEEGGAFISGQNDETNAREASVLTTAFELALVVLNGCLDVDGGRSLSLDHSSLLMGAGEWAGHVFSRLEKGALIEGAGAAEGVKLKSAVAGVLLKVDEITSKWRRSMVVR